MSNHQKRQRAGHAKHTKSNKCHQKQNKADSNIPKADSNIPEADSNDEVFSILEQPELSNYGVCHHCKQWKITYIMAKCNYNTKIHGNLMPAQHVMNGVQVHNVDPNQTSLTNQLILKKAISDKKKRQPYEESLDYGCNK